MAASQRKSVFSGTVMIASELEIAWIKPSEGEVVVSWIAARLAILLVEDDDLVRELAAEALTEQGFDVLEAHDGSTALALVEKGVPVDVPYLRS